MEINVRFPFSGFTCTCTSVCFNVAEVWKLMCVFRF